MLSFDMRSLATHAATVDGELEPDDPVWEADDPRPAGPIRVTGRLSPAGEGRYYFSGRLDGQLAGECRRCLADVNASVDEELHLLFADAGDEIDDPDVYPLDPRTGELDLRPAVREQWLISAPAFTLCREDCQGLCPTCGTDRNTSACDCAPASTDSRWDALRKASDERA